MENNIVTIENGEVTVSQEIINKIIEFNKVKKEMEYQEKLLKEGLMKAMQEVGKTHFAVNGLSAIIKAGSSRTTIDSTRLKTECPDIWECYKKETVISPSIVITIAD